MIEEVYISFETAKLLKEKGFMEATRAGYDVTTKKMIITFSEGIKHQSSNILPAPTQQLAMKWLREVHNIHIAIIPCEVGPGVMDYTYVLYKIDAKNFYFEDLGIQGRARNIGEISYEQICEAAIKYCLENLI